MTEMAAAPSRQEQPAGLSWAAARLTAHRAGRAAMLAEVTLPLWECDGGTVAGELRPPVICRPSRLRRLTDTRSADGSVAAGRAGAGG